MENIFACALKYPMTNIVIWIPGGGNGTDHLKRGGSVKKGASLLFTWTNVRCLLPRTRTKMHADAEARYNAGKALINVLSHCFLLTRVFTRLAWRYISN